MRTYSFLFILLLGLLAVQPEAAHAQFKKLKDRAKQHAEEKAIEKVIEKEDKAIDKALGNGAQPATPEQTQGDVTRAGETNAEGATPSEAAETLKPGEGVWANYDFVPGERPLFVDDFSADKVGNFPRRLAFQEGNMEVVEWQGRRFLRATAMGAFEIPLPESLPERFTIEFDAYSPNGDWIAVMTSTDGFEGGPLNYSQFPGSYFLLTGDEAGVEGKGPEAKTNSHALREGVVPVRISVDGSYAKMYLGEHRVANVPNANIVRGNKLHLIFWYARAESPSYLTNFRIAAGGEEQYDALYEALEAEGRVATQGILFDTGSDVLRPESTPTLQEIGQTLKDHPDLRLSIEGHTDNVGSEASNQQLSEARAAAVKAFLVAAYGLDETRLEAHGFGPSKPAASNDTPEGRQQNRRVELVKL